MQSFRLKDLFHLLRLLINFPQIIFINFYYLPFNQAIFLPIWIYNAKFKIAKGKVFIDNNIINSGMIRLGPITNSLYETIKNRFIWENQGVCCFKGKCIIGHNSAISIGNNGYLEFGNNFKATNNLKIACHKSIIFGNNVLFSWENIIMDTDYHKTINILTGKENNSTKDIIIGNNNWVGIRSIILKGTITPDNCIIGANSILNKKYEFPEYSLLAGNPLRIQKENIQFLE